MDNLGPLRALKYQTIKFNRPDVPSICSTLGITNHDKPGVVIFDSAKKVPDLGTQSIIGIWDANTAIISYHVGSKSIKVQKGSSISQESLEPYDGSIFGYVKYFLQLNQVESSLQTSSSRFWGGFMGYIDYEACLETIAVTPSSANPENPNISFAFIERSIVLSHDDGLLYVQSLKKDDREWVNKTVLKLQALDEALPDEHSEASRNSKDDDSSHVNIYTDVQAPEESAYLQKIQACARELASGNSYELCLTDQIKIKIAASDNAASSWTQYLRLRSYNPAPFAAGP